MSELTVTLLRFGFLALLWVMILAVVVLGFSLVRHLRKAEANKDAGLFGDAPRVDDEDDSADATDPKGPTSA